MNLTVAPPPGTPHGSPYTAALHMVGEWPVPQIGTRIYDLARCAAAGVPADQLAAGFEIEERDVVLLCCHFGIGVKRGAKHLDPLTRRLHDRSTTERRHPVQPSFVERSQPPDAPELPAVQEQAPA